jgi:hypothetical protein
MAKFIVFSASTHCTNLNAKLHSTFTTLLFLSEIIKIFGMQIYYINHLRTLPPLAMKKVIISNFKRQSERYFTHNGITNTNFQLGFIRLCCHSNLRRSVQITDNKTNDFQVGSKFILAPHFSCEPYGGNLITFKKLIYI